MLEGFLVLGLSAILLGSVGQVWGHWSAHGLTKLDQLTLAVYGVGALALLLAAAWMHWVGLLVLAFVAGGIWAWMSTVKLRDLFHTRDRRLPVPRHLR